MMRFKTKHLTSVEIYDYLTINENNFNPPLSKRINLKSYSLKLRKHATHFCVFDNNRIIGFAACYFNDPAKRAGYISSFSICKDYQRQGLATKLLDLIIDFAIIRGFEKICLTVMNNNFPGIKLYQKSGFIEEPLDHAESVIVMTLELQTKRFSKHKKTK